ncbi:MAG: Multidrug resistance protein MdtK [candidate division WS2 bacterium]|nr:Multidrug resistance protein MdtK [Candidatus Psychracetigena formicireducens]
MGFAVATTALVGIIVGEGDSSKAKRAAIESLKLAATIMSIFGIFFFFFPDLLVKLFTSDVEVINQSRDVIQIIALAQPFLAAVFVLEGALRGGGDTRTPMYITASGMWLVRLPLAYLLVVRGEMGLVGAWLAMSADIIYKGIMVFIMLKRKKSFKSHVEIEKQEEVILEG